MRTLAVDDEGALWVATTAGVQRFTTAEEGAEMFTAAATRLDPAGVRALHPGPDGRMWVGGQGASFFDGDTWATYTARDGLAGELVQAIATDSQGRTWLGTDGGLSIWNGDAFFNITAAQGLPSADIRALATAGDDAMWIGSWGGGLYRFADNQLEVFNVENTGLPADRIAALAVMPNGDLLLGTERGLARFASGVVTPVAAISAPVTAITVVDDAAWVATADGIFVQQGEGWLPVTVADGLPAATVTAIAATVDEVWLGGATGGLLAVER